MDSGTEVFGYACGFSDGDDGGIFVYEIDGASGDLRHVETVDAPAASYAALHPNGRYLYVTTRTGECGILAFSIDPEGIPVRADETSLGATDPCYLSIDETGRYLFTANYGDSSVAAVSLENADTFGEEAQTITHTGSSVNPERQEAPHPHSIEPLPGNRHVIVPDLGTDQVLTYPFAPEEPPLTRDGTAVSASPGAGPRHVAFHPDRDRCYVINELDSTISAYEFDAETGMLEETQTVETLPPEYTGENACAHICVHPNTEWLYASNRGHDSIVRFDIDQRGDLTRRELTSTEGHWPRHFAIDPSGQYLYVENRRSDSIVPFTIGESGELTARGTPVTLPEPICLVFGSVRTNRD